MSALWFGSYLLIALAALHPAEPIDEVDASAVEVLAATVLPYVTFGVAVLVGPARFAGGGRLDGMLGPIATALVFVLLARQAVSLVENRRLTLDLEGTLRRVEEQSRVLEHLASHDALTGLANRSQVVRRADLAMYAAKLGGKGRAVVYPSDVVAVLRAPQG